MVIYAGGVFLRVRHVLHPKWVDPSVPKYLGPLPTPIMVCRRATIFGIATQVAEEHVSRGHWP